MGMTTPICDHTSVGILIWRDGRLLIIERRKPPPGFAPPAGHVDDHGSYEDAATAEVQEEVGLEVVSLSLLGEGRRDNPCRRVDGTWHYWKIFEAQVTGTPKRSYEETKGLMWADGETLQKLANRTLAWQAKKLSDQQWIASPGLEPVWFHWLSELRVIHP
jgi:ADP-ribose pyrophosphatase YjhB (NUDIX family)